MKPAILLLALSAIVITSCTTAYKTGQTPDDVYYSPTRPQDEYVRTNNDDDQKYRGDDYYDDRYLRMKVHNRTQWSELDDWYYYGNRYSYTYYNTNSWNNPWTPYSYWNYYYNPYCSNYIIVNPKSVATYNKPRVTNLNVFNNNMLTNNSYTNPKNSNSGNNNTNFKFPTTNTNNNTGGFLRNLFSGNSESKTSSSSSNSSSSSGSSGSSGSSAPVRRF
jgi:hypothetical protein